MKTFYKRIQGVLFLKWTTFTTLHRQHQRQNTSGLGCFQRTVLVYLFLGTYCLNIFVRFLSNVLKSLLLCNRILIFRQKVEIQLCKRKASCVIYVYICFIRRIANIETLKCKKFADIQKKRCAFFVLRPFLQH